MNQSFAVTENGNVVMVGTQVQDVQMLVSADKFAIKPDAGGAGVEAEKADLLERRLRRIELALGIDATPESTAALEAELRKL